MTFWEHFIRVLVHKPVVALAALYWHITRRKVRARNRLRVASGDLPFAYSVWIANNEHTTELARDCAAVIERWNYRPRFSIAIHAGTEPSHEEVQRSIASVQAQIYPHWELVSENTERIDCAIEMARGDFLVPIRAGDELSRTALFHFAESLQAREHATILYGDEDRIDVRGRRSRPWFKPSWNEELFLALDYLSSAIAIRTSAAKDLAAEVRDDLSDLILKITSSANDIVHLPLVLVHSSRGAEQHASRIDAVARHIKLRGATCTPGPFGTIKIAWPLPQELPQVSIIVPTRDRLELLQPCIQGLLERTTYPNFEVVIVNNESRETRTVEYIREITRDPRVRVIDFPGSYNFSSMNNFACRNARGPYICLLNNDTEVIEPEWLTEMMRYAIRSDVGAVGAKLLYDDGSIQHAGVVIGLGEAAGHAHRFLPDNDPGYFSQPHVTQFMSAVTAACLVVDQRKFFAVGGLDESLAVAFNDVDFCLKLQAAGFRNVYVPHAVLVHHESKTRGSDSEKTQVGRYLRELKLLQDRWNTKNYKDPLHNPNLDQYTETFVISL